MSSGAVRGRGGGSRGKGKIEAVKIRPTAEQIQIARIMDSHRSEEPEIQKKIRQVMEITRTSEDEATMALHSRDYDIEQAITLLTDGGSTSLESEWEQAGKKRKTKVPPQKSSDSPKDRGEKEAGGDRPRDRSERRDPRGDRKEGEGEDRAERGGRGGRRGGRGGPRGGPDTRKRVDNKENDEMNGGRGSYGPPRSSNGPSRGGRGRGGERGRGFPQRARGRDGDGGGPPYTPTIEVWENSQAEPPAENKTLKMENWGEFPSAEDWDNEEYTGSLADTKVFTPTTGASAVTSVPLSDSTNGVEAPTVIEAPIDLALLLKKDGAAAGANLLASLQSSFAAADQPPPQPQRTKQNRPRAPPSKIPSTAVEMPDESVTTLDVQFGGLDFHGRETSFGSPGVGKDLSYGGPLMDSFDPEKELKSTFPSKPPSPPPVEGVKPSAFVSYGGNKPAPGFNAPVYPPAVSSFYSPPNLSGSYAGGGYSGAVSVPHHTFQQQQSQAQIPSSTIPSASYSSNYGYSKKEGDEGEKVRTPTTSLPPSSSTGGSGGKKSGMTGGIPPGMVLPQYIVNQGGVGVPSFYTLQPPFYPYDDVVAGQLVQRLQPQIPAGYYEGTHGTYASHPQNYASQAPPSPFAHSGSGGGSGGGSGRGGEGGIGFNANEQGRFNRSDSSTASPVPSGGGQPIYNTALPYYYNMAFNMYPPHLYQSPPTGLPSSSAASAPNHYNKGMAYPGAPYAPYEGSGQEQQQQQQQQFGKNSYVKSGGGSQATPPTQTEINSSNLYPNQKNTHQIKMSNSFVDKSGGYGGNSGGPQQYGGGTSGLGGPISGVNVVPYGYIAQPVQPIPPIHQGGENSGRGGSGGKGNKGNYVGSGGAYGQSWN